MNHLHQNYNIIQPGTTERFMDMWGGGGGGGGGAKANALSRAK